MRPAHSTLVLQLSIYAASCPGRSKRLNLDVIKPLARCELLDRVKTERGPGLAVHARNLVVAGLAFGKNKGVEVAHPVVAAARKASVPFVPREAY